MAEKLWKPRYCALSRGLIHHYAQNELDAVLEVRDQFAHLPNKDIWYLDAHHLTSSNPELHNVNDPVHYTAMGGSQLLAELFLDEFLVAITEDPDWKPAVPRQAMQHR
jgi:hypothetical protein